MVTCVGGSWAPQPVTTAHSRGEERRGGREKREDAGSEAARPAAPGLPPLPGGRRDGRVRPQVARGEVCSSGSSSGSSGSINMLWQVVAELLPPSASQDLLAACLQRQAEAGAGGWWPDLAPLLSAKIKHVKLDQQHAVSGDTSQHLAQVSIIITIYYIVIYSGYPACSLFHNLKSIESLIESAIFSCS